MTPPSTREAPRKTKPVRGSDASTKQVAQSVKDGRRVTFRTIAGGVQGYIGGMDDYHWVVVDQDAVIHLVHKSAAVVTISAEPTYQAEDNISDMEQVIAPFRKYVLQKHFGHTAN